jgi:hypothetical protein
MSIAVPPAVRGPIGECPSACFPLSLEQFCEGLKLGGTEAISASVTLHASMRNSPVFFTGRSQAGLRGEHTDLPGTSQSMVIALTNAWGELGGNWGRPDLRDFPLFSTQTNHAGQAVPLFCHAPLHALDLWGCNCIIVRCWSVFLFSPPLSPLNVVWPDCCWCSGQFRQCLGKNAFIRSQSLRGIGCIWAKNLEPHRGWNHWKLNRYCISWLGSYAHHDQRSNVYRCAGCMRLSRSRPVRYHKVKRFQNTPCLISAFAAVNFTFARLQCRGFVLVSKSYAYDRLRVVSAALMLQDVVRCFAKTILA